MRHCILACCLVVISAAGVAAPGPLDDPDNKETWACAADENLDRWVCKLGKSAPKVKRPDTVAPPKVSATPPPFLAARPNLENPDDLENMLRRAIAEENPAQPNATDAPTAVADNKGPEQVPAPAKARDSVAPIPVVAAESEHNDTPIPHPVVVAVEPGESKPEKTTVKLISTAKVGEIFLIKIMGVSRLSSIQKYLQSSQLPRHKLQLVKTRVSELDWWTLTYGEYSSAGAAQSALDELKIDPLINQVWIRKRKSFHGQWLALDGLASAPTSQPAPARESVTRNISGYTLQISSVPDPRGFDLLVQRSGLNAGDFMRRKVDRQGQPWWLLLYGQFGSRAEASRALAGLPAKLQRYEPWVRSLKELH